jgi:hypothetical protein
LVRYQCADLATALGGQTPTAIRRREIAAQVMAYEIMLTARSGTNISRERFQRLAPPSANSDTERAVAGI